ncbi:unnamed protein product [Prorocentrum cordatum]|uniref:Uncharacterized protein n=1 Tax=Prorocentrum cordatum TaxID=2364126 RepID=A0ABN9QRN2_9DINO|nr:unnamed protein product [Polarella glacialis]
MALSQRDRTPLTTVTLEGFKIQEMNVKYVERNQGEFTVNQRETFWSQDGQFFLYWDVSESRWKGTRAQDFAKVRVGGKSAFISAPLDNDILFPSSLTGWMEFDGKEWVRRKNAGIVAIGTFAAALRTVWLHGFDRAALNTSFTECRLFRQTVGDRETYWTADKQYFLFWDPSESRWKASVGGDLRKIQGGARSGLLGAPLGADLQAPEMARGWHEWVERPARARLGPERSNDRRQAPVLHLTELKDMTERTNGAMKYLARHSVVGRASIKRLLNPSALFETDATQQRVNYLRAETEVLQDTGRETGSPELAQYWGDLAAVAQRIDEPRMSNVSVKEVSAASHWQLAALWYKLRVAVHAHRSEAQVADAVNSWIQKEQEQGRMHKAAGDALETLPQPLLNQIKRLKGPLGPQLDMRFYEPFLTLLGTNDAQSRKQLMESMALEELKLTRTRASLKAMFH